MTNRRVAVVGSANLDVVVSLDHFPGPGETVLGEGLQHVAGGKGLNQATAASRHVPSTLISCVGNDEAGDLLLRHLEAAGVDTKQVTRVEGPTGRAFIQVTPDGENAIVVIPLANRRLTPDIVRSALDSARPAVVLTQLEVPLECVEAAADWASRHGARFLLNPSPIRELPSDLLTVCDPLVVNTGEAVSLLGDAPDAADSQGAQYAANLASRLAGHVRTVAVTAGARGVTVAPAPDQATHIEGVSVNAVDTTGAGDEFAGALAAALAAGKTLESAADMANRAAARIVSVPRAKRLPAAGTLEHHQPAVEMPPDRRTG